jgi:hypothetical protein
MSRQTKFKIGDKVRRTSHLANGTHTYGTVDTVVGIAIAGKKEWLTTKNNGTANCDAENYELVERAGEQRKSALEALNAMEANEYWRRGDFSENIATIREALQSPPVPVIEGLEEAIQHLIRVRDLYSREAERWRMEEEYSICEMFKTQSDWIRTCVKAAEEYSKLQKGEQNGHD